MIQNIDLHYYVLDGEEARAVSLEDYIKWATDHSTIIVQDRLGGVVVSTVFLLVDHSHAFGSPVLFETMVFEWKGFKDGSSMRELDEERYNTLSAAIVGHKITVEKLIANRFAYLINSGVYVSQEVERIYTNHHYKDKIQ